MAEATCIECGHSAEVSAPSDVWKCNCAAGVGPDDCDCDATNEARGTEDNPPEVDSGSEVAQLEARLLELRGGAVKPEGDVENA